MELATQEKDNFLESKDKEYFTCTKCHSTGEFTVEIIRYIYDNDKMELLDVQIIYKKVRCNSHDNDEII